MQKRKPLGEGRVSSVRARASGVDAGLVRALFKTDQRRTSGKHVSGEGSFQESIVDRVDECCFSSVPVSSHNYHPGCTPAEHLIPLCPPTATASPHCAS